MCANQNIPVEQVNIEGMGFLKMGNWFLHKDSDQFHRIDEETKDLNAKLK